MWKELGEYLKERKNDVMKQTKKSNIQKDFVWTFRSYWAVAKRLKAFKQKHNKVIPKEFTLHNTRSISARNEFKKSGLEGARIHLNQQDTNVTQRYLQTSIHEQQD